MRTGASHRVSHARPVTPVNHAGAGALAVVPEGIEIGQRWLDEAEQVAGRRDVRQVALALQLKSLDEGLSHRDIAEVISREVVHTSPSTVTRILGAAARYEGR